MLGLQPEPTVVEVAAWLLYLVPVLTFVLWPAQRPFPRRPFLTGSALSAVGAAVAALVLVTAEPSRPERRRRPSSATSAGALSVAIDADADTATATLAGAALGDEAAPFDVGR